LFCVDAKKHNLRRKQPYYSLPNSRITMYIHVVQFQNTVCSRGPNRVPKGVKRGNCGAANLRYLLGVEQESKRARDSALSLSLSLPPLLLNLEIST
jgi:hypothetical protein